MTNPYWQAKIGIEDKPLSIKQMDSIVDSIDSAPDVSISAAVIHCLCGHSWIFSDEITEGTELVCRLCGNGGKCYKK